MERSLDDVSPSMMCCDVNGLCVTKIGSDDLQPSQSGSYTAIVRLASQLSGISNPISDSSSESTSQNPIFVTIETDKSSTVMKRYGKHTVVFKAPPVEVLNDSAVSGDAPGINPEPVES